MLPKKPQYRTAPNPAAHAHKPYRKLHPRGVRWVAALPTNSGYLHQLSLDATPGVNKFVPAGRAAGESETGSPVFTW